MRNEFYLIATGEKEVKSVKEGKRQRENEGAIEQSKSESKVNLGRVRELWGESESSGCTCDDLNNFLFKV